MKNKAVVISLSLIGAFVLTFTSCTHDKADIEYPGPPCDTTNTTLSGEVTPIMESHCFRCHSSANAAESGGNYNLEDFGTIHAAAIDGRLLSSIQQDNKLAPPMPQDSAKISDCEINKFKAWIDRGALNN
jgi:hypothetical protein